ncbi:MAG: endonuclease V, partial [Bacteroidia bacterium]|nr:endonuclease V [Bacteroidia bacterium]
MDYIKYYQIDRLWKCVEEKYSKREMMIVAGVDVSYRDEHYTATLTLFEEGKFREIKVIRGVSKVPYRSSLFFLKEAPIISKLIYGERIDLLFVNGHGICHPYLYGLATVIGLTHGIPTIGFAHRLIHGDYREVKSENPDIVYITQHQRMLGAAIKTKKWKKPVFVSQGFGITLEKTIQEYMKWTKNGKLPEPLRLAHIYAKKGIWTANS